MGPEVIPGKYLPDSNVNTRFIPAIYHAKIIWEKSEVLLGTLCGNRSATHREHDGNMEKRKKSNHRFKP
jgi:hypothetical protein